MININGKSYSGNNLSISNGIVSIDGIEIGVEKDTKIINISIEGNVNSIKCDSADNINVNGSVGQLSTVSGDVSCGNVSGSISAISGDVQVNGNVGGSVSTISGDINHR